jgi:hypothetical protein
VGATHDYKLVKQAGKHEFIAERREMATTMRMTSTLHMKALLYSN